MTEISIGYFLEDQGHTKFLMALVERIALERGMSPLQLHSDVRNATGGRGVVLDQLQRYLRDVQRERDGPFDILVVAMDGNCRGALGRRREIMDKVKASAYPGRVVYATPDPHIERWYLADPVALRTVLKAPVTAPSLPHKCEKGRYKQALRDVIKQADLPLQLGGAEYGAEIAQAINLFTVGRVDTAFKRFIDELQSGLAPFV